jgi:hypothetical protein
LEQAAANRLAAALQRQYCKPAAGLPAISAASDVPLVGGSALELKERKIMNQP